MANIQPRLPAHAMKTYSVIAPRSTHFRAVTCREANCPNFANGWRVHLQRIQSWPNGAQLIAHIKTCGKRYTLLEVSADETWFVFEAGQTCFDGDAGRHQTRVGKPELFVVRGGDWRGNPRGDRFVHASAADWVDDMQNHRDKLAREVAQG